MEIVFGKKREKKLIIKFRFVRSDNSINNIFNTMCNFLFLS